MAAEHRKPFILFRPGFILLCLYVAAYAWLRSAEQILLQPAVLSAVRGAGMSWTIAPSPDMPHWRRQLWRAVFSLPMVVEEEARKNENSLRELYDEAMGAVGRKTPPNRPFERIPVQQEQIDYQQQLQHRQYLEQQYQEQLRRQAQAQQPPQQQQRQYSFSQQPQTYPPLNEGERLIYMPTPEEQLRQQSLYRSAQ